MSEGMFPNHPRSGDWETLKGRMLSPHMTTPLTSTAHGDSRHQAEAKSIGWESHIIVNTGMTRGGGTMAK
jgi:hypothetical protein